MQVIALAAGTRTALGRIEIPGAVYMISTLSFFSRGSNSFTLQNLLRF